MAFSAQQLNRLLEGGILVQPSSTRRPRGGQRFKTRSHIVIMMKRKFNAAAWVGVCEDKPCHGVLSGCTGGTGAVCPQG